MNTENKSGNRMALPDILKGIAVIRMILVHLFEVFATPEIYQDNTWHLLVFLAGPPGAALFMVIMGYFIARSSADLKSSINRGFKLLLWGLLLNIGMNFHLLVKILSGAVSLNPWPYVFGVDILFLAGFSMILLGVLKTLFRNRVLPFVVFTLLIASIGSFLPSYNGDLTSLKYVLSFFVGGQPWSYFPLIPWAAYPLAGYVLYQMNEKFQFSGFSRKGMLYVASSMFIILALSFTWGFKTASSLELYYNHSLLFFLWILLLILFWVIIIHLITMKHTNTTVVKYLRWVGRYVTNFYVFQWLLIGNIGTAIYKTQQGTALLLWFLFILITTSLLVYLWRKIRVLKT
ncbi:MAG: DUF1624 domain-containing protein [Bacteroidales bacterium]|nr:DUF1624 domain-containing protein [Bacteroidales bacterium]